MNGKKQVRINNLNKGGEVGRIDLLSNQSTVMSFGGGQRIALKRRRAKEIHHKVS